MTFSKPVFLTLRKLGYAFSLINLYMI